MNTPTVLSNEQIDDLWLYRKNIHGGRLTPQLHDFARAVESALLSALKEGAAPVMRPAADRMPIALADYSQEQVDAMSHHQVADTLRRYDHPLLKSAADSIDYLAAQEGLLEKAQQAAERARADLEEHKRPLDEPMARLNRRVIDLTAELDALRHSIAAPAAPADPVAPLVATQCVQRLMARLADLLDDDKFNECEAILQGSGIEPAQPATAGCPLGSGSDALLRQALCELVACKDLKDAAEGLHFAGPLSPLGEGWKAEYDRMRKDYLRRQPRAWDAARAAIRALSGGAEQGAKS